MIQQATLTRLEKSDSGTFGVLSIDGEVFCLTLELADKGNAQNISCIPEGEYQCAPVNSPRFGRTFEVVDVPGRTDILFHVGNRTRDSLGCILLGSRFGRLEGDRAVLSSGAAVKEFLERAGDEPFPFRIVDASGV